MSGYQSRVFTFISKRTNQLKDTCTKGLRHLKVAVVWSGQALLYPLHLLAQTAKIFQPQLAPPQPQRALTSQPVPDLNIEQALELVAATEYPIAIAGVPLIEARSIVDENLWNVEHIQIDEDRFDRDLTSIDRLAQSDRVTIGKPIIRGMSSLLVDRQLVLVTTTNEIIDILTSSQQQEIRRRIGMDLAISWEYWHQATLSDRQYSPQLSSTDREFLLPDRLEYQMYSSRKIPTPQPPKLFAAPSKIWQQLTGWVKKAIPPQTTIEKPQLPRKLPSASYPFIPPPIDNRFLDLPQLPPIKQPQTLASQEHPVRTSQFPPLLKQWWNYYRDYFYIPARPNDSIVHQPAEFKLTPLRQSLESRIQLRSKNTQLKETFDRQNLTPPASDINHQRSGKLSRRIDRHIEHYPDWIEADVEDIGYIKSPLARFLAWLDRITLNLENWLIKIWRAFKQLTVDS
ncbi:hypothetical protein [Chamaesiphon sp.]|uniref:hypothetical protein n=1 Tax=Chamaesiphon sp. TaxID=2814140 RepID=UPI003594664E